MELFATAKAVRLKSSHGKYLTADEDEESVVQARNGSSKSAKWTVEFVPNSDNDIIRLKSCYGKYLTASNLPFLLGMTGRKVMQTLPRRLDSSVEWEPVRAGNGVVNLKTRYGQFLRANTGMPPWRNSVTHDSPHHRTTSQEWIVWEVHVVEILVKQSPVGQGPPPLAVAEEVVKEEVVKEDSIAKEKPRLSSSRMPSFASIRASLSRQESKDSFTSTSPPKGNDGRIIHFHIADEHGVVDEGFEEMQITFHGKGVQELTSRLADELGLDDITVCTRSPLNGKLYPLHLQLPPNNSTMHVVVIPPSSQVDQDFEEMGMAS